MKLQNKDKHNIIRDRESKTSATGSHLTVNGKKLQDIKKRGQCFQ